MKKSHKIFLSVLFCFLVALPIATSFLWQENSIESSSEISKISAPKIDVNTSEEEPEEKSTWTSPTFKTYDEYFTELDITAETITNEDYTGTGNAVDPFIIHSTRGFLYLTNSDISGINLASKYVQLNCDIILNDEKFDENGNPSGGDGIVFSWQGVESGSITEFDGNNHTIYGMYFNDDTATYFAMFLSVATIENLIIDNSFVRGKSSLSCLSCGCTNLINVHTKNGYIIGENSLSGVVLSTLSVCQNVSNGNNITQLETTLSGSIGGICEAVGKTFENCINYGNIFLTKVDYAGGLVCRGGGTNLKNYGTITGTGSATGVGGIAGYSVGTFTNCENYGKIINYQNRVIGGIVGYNYGNAIYKNCKNYADLTGASGIAGWGHCAEFYNCVNYGNISNTNAGMHVGGILGSANQSDNGTVIFKDCINYGSVENGSAFSRSISYFSIEMIGCENYGVATHSSYHGDLIGQIPYINNVDKRIIIKDCYNAGGEAILGRMYTLNKNNKNIKLIVENIQIDVPEEKDELFFIIDLEGMFSVDISNIFVKCEKSVQNLRIFKYLGWEIESFNVRNVLFQANQSTNTNFVYTQLLGGLSKERINLSNLVVQNTRGQSCYYGDDFSEYYVDWKSGKIGLKISDSKGFYQGEVTEEVLGYKGFTKKTI